MILADKKKKREEKRQTPLRGALKRVRCAYRRRATSLLKIIAYPIPDIVTHKTVFAPSALPKKKKNDLMATVDFASMSNTNNKDKDEFILNICNYPVVTDSIFPKAGKIFCEWLSKPSRIFISGYARIEIFFLCVLLFAYLI